MSYFTRNMDKCSRLHSFPVTRYIIVTFILSHLVGLEGPDHCLVTVLLLAPVLLYAVDEEAEADPAIDVPLVGPLDHVRYLEEFKLYFLKKKCCVELGK